MRFLKLGKSFPMPTSACPSCGTEMSAASALTDKKTAASPGDFSICIDCAEILRYGDDLQLSMVDDQELIDLDVEVRNDLLTLSERFKEAIARATAAGEWPPPYRRKT